MPEDVTGADAADAADPISSAIVASGVNTGVEKEGDGGFSSMSPESLRLITCLTADKSHREGKSVGQMHRDCTPAVALRESLCGLFLPERHQATGKGECDSDARGRRREVLSRYGIGSGPVARDVCDTCVCATRPTRARICAPNVRVP